MSDDDFMSLDDFHETARARKAGNRHEEEDHQSALFSWASKQIKQYPGIEWMFSIPQGTMLAGKNEFIQTKKGRRVSLAMLRGKRLKRMGLKAGVSDIFLPIPRREYHGLFLEMKSLTGSARDAQLKFGFRMRDFGYQWDVCRGWEAAAEAIKAYYS